MKYKVQKNIIVKGKVVAKGGTIDLQDDESTRSLLSQGYISDESKELKAEKPETKETKKAAS